MSNPINTKLLHAVGVGIVLSDIIPTQPEAVAFYRKNISNQPLGENNPKQKQFCGKEVFNYYAMNPIWWLGVLGITPISCKTYEQKRNILIGLVSCNTVPKLFEKNINKYKEFYNNGN